MIYIQHLLIIYSFSFTLVYIRTITVLIFIRLFMQHISIIYCLHTLVFTKDIPFKLNHLIHYGIHLNELIVNTTSLIIIPLKI